MRTLTHTELALVYNALLDKARLDREAAAEVAPNSTSLAATLNLQADMAEKLADDFLEA